MSTVAERAAQEAVFSAASVDFCALRDSIATFGCFVLRGLFEPTALAKIRHRAVCLSEEWDDRIARGDTDGIADYIASSAFAAGHLPETDIGATETWADLTSGCGALYDEIAHNLFGVERPRDYALRRSFLHGKQNPVFFHQDGFFVGTAPSFNVWTPLQDVGVTAAAVEVVVRSGSPLITNVSINTIPRVAAYIDGVYGPQSYWLPSLNVGDVLVFTSMMFHRTQVLPPSQKLRFSLELRGKIAKKALMIAGTPDDWSQIELKDAPL